MTHACVCVMIETRGNEAIRGALVVCTFPVSPRKEWREPVDRGRATRVAEGSGAAFVLGQRPPAVAELESTGSRESLSQPDAPRRLPRPLRQEKDRLDVKGRAALHVGREPSRARRLRLAVGGAAWQRGQREPLRPWRSR